MATIITTVNDLQNMDLDLAADYELGNDIDASGTVGWNGGLGFSPIGFSALTQFTGSFDGKGFKITGLFINRATDAGLFWQIGAAATINDCRLESINMTGLQLGAIADRNYGAIRNSYATGQVTATSGTLPGAGGIVCSNYGIIEDSYSTCSIIANVTDGQVGGFCQNSQSTGRIERCYATGNVTSKSNAAGFVGSNRGIIRDCYCTGNVTATDPATDAGGFCRISLLGTIERCYATGDVIAADSAAGFISSTSSDTISECFSTGNVTCGGDGGGFAQRNNSNIRNCYSRGDVIAGGDAGGFVQQNVRTITNCYSSGTPSGVSVGGFCETNTSIINGCFWDAEASGIAASDGGTGLTTSEMQSFNPFVSASWDIYWFSPSDAIWIMPKWYGQRGLYLELEWAAQRKWYVPV